MKNNSKQDNANGLVIWFIMLMNAIILKTAYLHHPKWYWWLLASVPLLIIAIVSGRSKRHQAA